MSDLYSRPQSGRSRQRRRPRTTLSLPPALYVVAAVGVLALLFVMFPLDWLRKPKLTLVTDQTLFSPNRDGTLDEIAVFYGLSEKATVSAEVLNGAGQSVRTLMRELPQTAGQHTAAWDGRDQGGNVVADGNYTIKVTAAGTLQSVNQTTSVTVDNTPPSLIIANFPPTQTTRTATFQLEGTTSSDATVFVNNDPAPVLVDATGTFRVTRQLLEGSNIITVRASDSAGNTNQAESEVVLRTAPPGIALSSPAADTWFNNSIVNVAGQVPADVNVAVNGKPAEVDASGIFSLDLLLQEGDNIIRVVATDPVGNTATEEVVVHVRTQGPTITLANVPDGLIVDAPTLRVSGKVEPGSVLSVNGGSIPTDNQGTFSTVVTLQEGNNLLTLTATDRAGNTTTLQRVVVYEAAPPPATLPTLPEVAIEDWTLPAAILGVAALAIAGFFLAGALRRPIRLGLSVDRPTFYPNHPDDSSLLTIRLDVSRNARVSIHVNDEMGRPVTSLVENRRYNAGVHTRLWDGRNSFRHLLPSGLYQIEATAHSTFSSVSSGVWVTMDTTPVMLGAAPASTSAPQRNPDRERERRYFDDDEQVVDGG
jgi:flagellar hook assembly protein FlgD